MFCSTLNLLFSVCVPYERLEVTGSCYSWNDCSESRAPAVVIFNHQNEVEKLRAARTLLLLGGLSISCKYKAAMIWLPKQCPFSLSYHASFVQYVLNSDNYASSVSAAARTY